ncbi:hypothetical protein OF829_12625 [Sphingomonas sp. LB-2]|uniref:hypothetical protein n=1 Tax=Sphingomonas caeni TaxID=2984949 RepID=UPI00222E7918|nr:hypothetical protein [Sphingomonas caeni]MCW3848087.1 hypothetical protein [Sphingomonas caeni]
MAQLTAVLLACWWDNSWTISASGKFTEGGRGFLQHYGAWAILLTDPLLLVASGFLDRQFCVAILTLPARADRDAARAITRSLREYLPWVRGKGTAALFYALCLITGLFAWTYNVASTIDPLGALRHPIFAHHDVFDSGLHMRSFIAFKACLFLSWVVVYPIVGFKLVTIIIATRSILRRAEKHGLLQPRVEHPDGCYGLKNVGTLNIAILVPCLLAFFVMFALLVTHQMMYESILIPLIVVSTVFLVTSFIVIWPAQMVLWQARDKEFRDLAKSSRQPPPASDRDLFQFTARRFFFSAAKASPYSDTTKVIILAMRATPPVVSLAIHFFP